MMDGLRVAKGGTVIIDGHRIGPGNYDAKNLPALPEPLVDVVEVTHVVFTDDHSVRVAEFLRIASLGVRDIDATLVPLA